MTEPDARVLLRNRGSFDVIDGWIAEQAWQVAPGGWAVTSELQGWHFSLKVIPTGLRISAGEPGTKPAVWVVTR